jgi:tRNA(Leu) C34 or U34 (ribose-2'-O)-methylase TrmL
MAMVKRATPLPAVILTRVKYSHNLAAAIRACSCFGVPSLFWTGQRFTFADGERLPREERMRGYADVTTLATERPFDLLPPGTTPVCVELTYGAMPMHDFVHPERAAYVFGPEDGDVSQAVRAQCHRFVYIESRHCLNLAAAMNVVLYDRVRKLGHQWSPVTAEGRGEITVPGWESR